jgi:hypothetical protein
MKPLLYSLAVFVYSFTVITLGAYTWPVLQ